MATQKKRTAAVKKKKTQPAGRTKVAKKPPPKIEANKDAIRWFRAKVPVTKRKWRNLDAKAREHAFTVAGIAKLDLIGSVMKDVLRALKRGESMGDFKKRVSAKLTRAWKEERPYHVELIYRNAVQSAYSHGREAELRSPEVLSDHPYWMHSSIMDSRTTELICRPLNGLVLPAEHPYWKTHTPPLHHGCRSIKRALTVQQAQRRGIATQPPKVEREGENADFGRADPLKWKPDLSAYPQALAREYRRKQR